MWKLVVLLGPRWVQFYILVCGLMKLEFNFHTKERENPQIYEKPYPPDLFFTVTAVVVSGTFTKAPFS